MRQPVERAYFSSTHADGHPCAVHAKPEWARKHGLKAITRAEAEAISAARRAREPKREASAIPIKIGDEHSIQRLEECARQINEAAVNADDLRRTQGELQELARMVGDIASMVQQLSQRPAADGNQDAYAQLVHQISALSGDLQHHIERQDGLHAEAGRRLAYLNEQLVGLTARVDDLTDRVTGLAAYRPSEPKPPEHIPPPPNTGHQSGWVRGVLEELSDDDPLPDRPQSPQGGQENEPGLDTDQDENAPPEATSPAQRIDIQESRHLVVDDRYAKPFARYQIAVQAKNGTVTAKHLLQAAAERHGVSIEELADRIISEWRQIEHQVMADY